MEGKWRHCYTAKIEREVFRILGNIRANENYRKVIRTLYETGQEILRVKNFRIIRDDPDDDKYLECADACSADYLLSNDRHLLKLESFHGTEIIRPVQFTKEEEKLFCEK